MGLGNTGMMGFKPQKSKTAANLLKVTNQAEPKKEGKINLRISGDLYMVFQELCELNKTSVSEAIRAYITDAVQRGEL